MWTKLDAVISEDLRYVKEASVSRDGAAQDVHDEVEAQPTDIETGEKQKKAQDIEHNLDVHPPVRTTRKDSSRDSLLHSIRPSTVHSLSCRITTWSSLSSVSNISLPPPPPLDFADDAHSPAEHDAPEQRTRALLTAEAIELPNLNDLVQSMGYVCLLSLVCGVLGSDFSCKPATQSLGRRPFHGKGRSDVRMQPALPDPTRRFSLHLLFGRFTSTNR